MSDQGWPPPPGGSDWSQPSGENAGWQQGAPQPSPEWGPPGQPTWGTPMPTGPQRTNSNATVSLIMGILSIVICPLTAIVGLILGRKAKQEITASRGVEGGEGLATAGIVTSIVGLVFMGLGILAILAITFLGTASTTRFEQVGNSVGGSGFGADSYGDDPYLDDLYDGCRAGNMVDCDDLYWDSPVGSDYEQFGRTCGGRGGGGGGFCA